MSELRITDTELNAIANPASAGFKISPKPLKTPAAIGIPTPL